MEENKKPVRFEELYPDYPIKAVPKGAYLNGWLAGAGVMAAFVGAVLGTLYVLSITQIPFPSPLETKASVNVPIPESEDELLQMVPYEKLVEIGMNCVRDKDFGCSKKVFARVLELKPNDRVAKEHYSKALKMLEHNN